MKMWKKLKYFIGSRLLSEYTVILFILAGLFAAFWLSKWFFQCKFFTAVFFSLFSLLFLASITMILQTYMKKTIVKVVSFCVIFILGVCCYYKENIIISACASLAEFFPSRGSYTPEEYRNNNGMIVFYIASYFFAISMLVSLFGRKLTNGWQRLFAILSNRSKCRVFWTKVPGEKEILLADNLRKGSAVRCIFSVEEFDLNDEAVFMEDLNFHGHLLYLRKPEQIHSGTLKPPVHFFITADCNWNIRMAQKVWDKIRAKGKILQDIKFFVRISGGAKAVWSGTWAEKLQAESGGKLEIHLIVEDELIARKLFHDHPLLDSPGIEIVPDSCKVNGKFKILLLGFGELGESILRSAVCSGQFLHENASADDFSVDVVDNLSDRFDVFAARSREAVKEYNIAFENLDIHSGKFYEFLEKKLSSYNRIIVCFADHTLNMDAAAVIIENAKVLGYDCKNRLFVHLPGTFNRADALENLTLFGSINECYSKAVIVHEHLDRDARRINMQYNQGVDNWREITLFNRDSNRSTAAGLYNLCRLLGIKDPAFGIDPAVVAKIKADKELLEACAETEHLRWMAFLRMYGISRWDVSQLESISSANEVATRRRHAALVPYRELPEIGKKIPGNKDFQENCRQIVQLMADIFSAGKTHLHQ